MSMSPADQLAKDGFYLAKSVIPEEHLDKIENEVKGLSKSFGVEGDNYPSIWNNATNVSRETAGLIYNGAKRLPSVVQLPNKGVIQFAESYLNVKLPALVDVNFRIDAPQEDKYAFDWHQDYWFSVCSPLALVAWTPLVATDSEIGGVEVYPQSDESHKIYKVKRNQVYNSYSSSVLLDESLPSSPTLTPSVEPGDCLFFRFHMLHRSIPNISKNRQRWTIQSRIADFADPEFKYHEFKPGIVTKDFISYLDDEKVAKYNATRK